MTENKAAAFVALAEVQSKLGVRKIQQNNFDGYAYYSVGDILNELKPLLKEYQAAVYFNESLEVVSERIYVHSTAHFVYQGYEILATGIAREEENPTGKKGAGQETGVAIARKYALDSLFLISEDGVSENNSIQSNLSQVHQETNTQSYVEPPVSNRTMSPVDGVSAEKTSKPSTPPGNNVGADSGTPHAREQVSDEPEKTNVADKPNDSDKFKAAFNRGIDMAISLGADEEQVFVWKHEMTPNDAIRDMSQFVIKAQQQQQATKG
ncbi:TPA: ERF family protein [Streptococcus suis]|nr:ERF family protein [Streptococcus suis]